MQSKKRHRLDPPLTPIRNETYLFYIIIVMCSFIYDVIYSEPYFDLQAVQNDLKNKIHQQTDATEVVIHALSQMYTHDERLTILCLIGPSGVGKTYTTNIIKKHFLSPIYSINGPLSQQKIDNIVNKMLTDNHNTYNLVIFDDLTAPDVDQIINFVGHIPQDMTFLVVCVFSIQKTDDQLNSTISYNQIDKIRDEFVDAGVVLKLAVFREFSASQAVNWVEKQLIHKGINPERRDDILKTVDDQDVKYRGLKGLDAKIRLIL